MRIDREPLVMHRLLRDTVPELFHFYLKMGCQRSRKSVLSSNQTKVLLRERRGSLRRPRGFVRDLRFRI